MSSHQNYLGVDIDEKLNSAYHIKEKVNKPNKAIAIIIQLQTKLSRNALLTIYKSL